jgi:hypothetical protein
VKKFYILPLGYVVESLQPLAQDIKEISGQGQVLRVRGEYLPLIRFIRFSTSCLPSPIPRRVGGHPGVRWQEGGVVRG